MADAVGNVSNVLGKGQEEALLWIFVEDDSVYGSSRNWQSIKLCLGLVSLWRTVLGVSEQSFDSNTCSRVSNFWNCSSECDNYCRSSFQLCDHFVRSISPCFLKSWVPLKSYVILEYFALVLLVISVSPFLNCKICPWKVFIFDNYDVSSFG